MIRLLRDKSDKFVHVYYEIMKRSKIIVIITEMMRCNVYIYKSDGAQ